MYEVMLICVFGRWLNLFPFITIADLFEFISTYFLLLPFSLFSYFLLDLKDAFLLLNPTCLESSRLHFYSSWSHFPVFGMHYTCFQLSLKILSMYFSSEYVCSNPPKPIFTTQWTTSNPAQTNLPIFLLELRFTTF